MESFNQTQASENIQKWNLHEHVDCKDPCDKWLDAVILDLKHHESDNGGMGLVDIKVSYTGFSQKYDEWIVAAEIPSRVLKQWDVPDGGLPDFNKLQVNNRIDVWDTPKNKWREARVIDLFTIEQPGGLQKTTALKVHFKGLHSKFDEIIDQADFERMISPISRHMSKRKGAKKEKMVVDENENVNYQNDEIRIVKDRAKPTDLDNGYEDDEIESDEDDGGHVDQ